jgi:hypothetical protein
VADVTRGGGDPALELDSAEGVAATSAALTMNEPAAEAPFSRTHSGEATPEIVLEVDTTTTTDVATACDGDGNKLEVVTGHPGLCAPRHISLYEAMGTTHFMLRQAQDVLQREWADIEEER